MDIRTLRPATSLLAAAALLTGVASPAAAQVTADGPGTFAFTDVTVLPMDGSAPREGRTVIVQGEAIVEVGAAGQVEIPEGAIVIAGGGRYLMPGLAEMHAHVPPVQDGWPSDEALNDLLFLYVANGVTTIRGMLGSPYQLELREQLARRERLGPTFYVGAPSINGNSAPTPDAAEAMIRRHTEAGYDLQKIHPGVARETWDHMVDVAREVGLTYAGHVPADVGIEHALSTGISTVDHMDGYLEATGSPAEGWDDARLRELAAMTAETGRYVVPTQYLWANLFGYRSADDALSDPEMRYVSPQQRQAWRNQAQGRQPLPGEQLEAFMDARDRMLRYLAEAGAPLLMGTDSPQLFNVPGFALHRELAAMREAGLDNRTILASGTANVGRYVREELGLDHAFGTIAPGQRADLVLLEANPLDDLENLTERVGVMVRGRWVSRAEIDRGLAALAAKHAGG